MRRTLTLALVVASCAVTQLPAQRLWLPADQTRNINFEFAKGIYPHGDLGFASFAFTASGRFPVNEKTAVTVGLPVARVSESGNGFAAASSSSAIGNPWIGVEYRADSGVVIEAGIRPGFASDDASHEEALLLGVLNDFDRFEAWGPKLSSGRFMLHVGNVPDDGAFVTGIFGATLAIPSQSRSTSSNQVYLNYGLRAGVRSSDILGAVAVTGRLNLSESGASLDERTVHQIGVSLERARGAFRPMASYSIYLKSDIRDDLSGVLKVGAAVVY